MASITTDDGVRLHVDVAPDNGKPPLIFSNSLGTDLRLWDRQVDALENDHRIIRYDTRGHGQSEVPSGDVSIERLGRDVIAVLDGLGIARVAYCGLSLGGMTGQWLGVNAGGRIDRLILSNTAAHMGPPENWQTRIDLVAASGMAPLVESVVERWFTPGFRERSPGEVERIRAMLLATPPAGYASCCAAIRDMDQRAAITAIRVPTLVIAADADPATPPAAGRLIHDAIADSEFAVISDAAHLSNIEQPEIYNRLLAEFLAE